MDRHSARYFEGNDRDDDGDDDDDYDPEAWHPLFLYYAPALVHAPFQAPREYEERCGGFDGFDNDDAMDAKKRTELRAYCGMIVMMDEVRTCLGSTWRAPPHFFAAPAHLQRCGVVASPSVSARWTRLCGEAAPIAPKALKQRCMVVASPSVSARWTRLCGEAAPPLWRL